MGGVLFIITARGGSKRLPRKNALPLAGKPLLEWTIDAALGCSTGGIVCVSTDDGELARIASEAGAEVPFMRPSELASDSASSVDVVRHALDFYRDRRRVEFESLVLLQPTSPLRDSKDIDRAFEVFREKRATAVISVCAMDHSPLWANVLPPDGSFDGFISPDVMGLRSQDLPQYYRINGAIYISTVSSFRTHNSFFPPRGSYAHIMSVEHSIDIDTEFDFRIAEALIAASSGTR